MNHQNKMKKNFDIISYSLIIDETNTIKTANDKAVNEATCYLLEENKTVDDNTVNEKKLKVVVINKPLSKLFNGLKKLYKFYNFKSCPSG